MPIKKRVSTSLDETPFVNKTQHNSKKFKILFILLIILCIALVATLISRHNINKKIDLLDANKQSERNKQETAALVKKISKLIVLPSDETPTVATITDAVGLAKNQSFYKGSQDGDKVLIYFKAQKAYIYSPTLDRLINVGPVFVDSKTNTSTPSVEQEKKKVEQLSIEIRNGSSVVGSANQLGDKLKSDKYYNVVSVGNAATTTYSSTILVDLSFGRKDELVKKIESTLNIKATTTLPNNEVNSLADVLIIVGK